MGERVNQGTMVQLFSKSFVLLYKKIHLKLDSPRALLSKFYTVPKTVNSVREEVDRSSQFSAPSFFNFLLSIHHLNSTNASITCTWTFFTASFHDESDCLNHNFCESKKVKKTCLAKKIPTKVVIVLTNLSSLHLVWQILFKYALRLILIIYNSLQNRLTVSRIYVVVTNQANQWKKSLLN